MTTPRIHRFDFNALRDFRGPIVVNTIEEPVVEPPPPPAPVFSEADLEAARVAGRKQGYTEGFTAGQLEARKQFDIKTDATNIIIGSIADTVSDLQQRYLGILSSESAQLSQLVLSVARKVAGDAIDARGEQAIEAIVAQSLAVIFSKPRLIIEMNPDTFSQVVDRIEEQLRTHGFEGEIQFKGNPALGMSDITLDWGNGQMERNVATLWSEVEAIIARVPLELTFAETLENSTTTGANHG